MNEKTKIIGIDFDNTLINYDNLIYSIAIERGLIDPEVNKNKKHIRDIIRLMPKGETKWQEVQAKVYGENILRADMDKEALQFIRVCIQKKIKVFIISHKTEFAAQDDQHINLRHAALKWLTVKGFFDDNLIRTEDVYFEPTRKEKIERIKKLGCHFFVDDLEETFLEPSFPKNVFKILYDPHNNYKKNDCLLVNTWQDMGDYFFNEDGSVF